MSNIYYVTRKGLNVLTQKLKELVKDLEKSTRAMGHSASLDNDLRENPEFMQLRTKVTYELPGKITELERVIRLAKLINDMEHIRNLDLHEVMPGMEVEMGSAQMLTCGAVTDGRVITGRAAGTAFDFALELIRALRGEEAAQKVASGIVYRQEV